MQYNPMLLDECSTNFYPSTHNTIKLISAIYLWLHKLLTDYTRNLRAPLSTEKRNIYFKRNHVAAASQQKQVLVWLTGTLQALLIYEKRVELLMELMR